MVDPVSLLTGLLAKNPVVAGGGSLMLMGGAMAYLRNIPKRILAGISYFFHFSIVIDSKSDAYPYLKDWIMEQSFTSKARHLSVDTIFLDQHNRALENHTSSRVRLAITPAVGWNLAWIDGHPIILRFSRTQPQDKKDAGPTEAVQMRAFSRKGLEAARSVFENIGNRIEGKLANKVKLFRSRSGYAFGWGLKGAIDKRSMDTIITDKNFLPELAEDIRTFQKSKEWYASKGIPWRRGYILHGPAGSGKSSMIQSLASELGLDIYYLNPKHAGDSDILGEVPPNGLLVVEEVDTLFSKRGNGKPKNRRQKMLDAIGPSDSPFEDDSDDDTSNEDVLTRENNKEFNAFINALDGIMATEGRVLIMTTNHYDQLDPALIRPGRADRTYYVGNATQYQLYHMFLKFFPDAEPAAEAFSHMIPAETISVARLQEHLMTYRNSPDEALAHADQLIQKEETSAAVPV